MTNCWDLNKIWNYVNLIGMTYYYPTLQSMVSTTVRKKRPIRRERRDTNWNNDTEKMDDFGDRATPSPDDLYQVLIMAAEGYVHINGI